MNASLCCLAFGLAVLPAALGFAQQNEVLVGTGEFPPFATDKTPDQGCVIKIVKSAFEAEGWTVKLRFMPWPRNLKMLSNGDIEGSAYWMDRPDRREEYIFPKYPVTSEVYRFVFRKDSKIDWQSYEDFADKMIILNSDYTYSDDFLNAFEEFGIKRHEVATEDLNLKMILKGRGDLTILNESVYQKYFDELSEDQQAALSIDTKPALVNQGYLVFSKENLERSKILARVFDTGYKKIEKRDDLKNHFEICGLL